MGRDAQEEGKIGLPAKKFWVAVGMGRTALAFQRTWGAWSLAKVAASMLKAFSMRYQLKPV